MFALLIDLLSSLLNLLDLLLSFLIVHAPLRQLHHLIQTVLAHLAVGFVLDHQIRNFNFPFHITKCELRGQIIRHCANGDVSFWHINWGVSNLFAFRVF